MSKQKKRILIGIDEEMDLWIEEAINMKSIRDIDGEVVTSRIGIVKEALAKLLGKHLPDLQERESTIAKQNLLRLAREDWGFISDEQVILYYAFMKQTMKQSPWSDNQKQQIMDHMIKNKLAGNDLVNYLDGLANGTVKLEEPVVVPEGF